MSTSVSSFSQRFFSKVGCATTTTIDLPSGEIFDRSIARFTRRRDQNARLETSVCAPAQQMQKSASNSTQYSVRFSDNSLSSPFIELSPDPAQYPNGSEQICESILPAGALDRYARQSLWSSSSIFFGHRLPRRSIAHLRATAPRQWRLLTSSATSRCCRRAYWPFQRAKGFSVQTRRRRTWRLLPLRTISMAGSSITFFISSKTRPCLCRQGANVQCRFGF